MMKTIPFYALLLAFILPTVITHGQESWDLKKCILYARQNSLGIKQAQYTIRNAELLHKQDKHSRLPNLNANTNFGYQFGRTIDPTTNDFDNQSIGFNGYSISSGVLLFNGNNINNSIKQSKINLEAVELDAQSTANDISLNVAFAFLNILLSQEQEANAEKRLEQSERQLEQTDKLIRAGSLPQNDRLDVLAQIAQDKQGIVDAQNLVSINYLNLKQLLEVDPNLDLKIVAPADLSIPLTDPSTYSLEETYLAALQNQPQIRASDLRIESARLGEAIAKAATMPSLFLSGSLSSNYSTLSKDFLNPDVSEQQVVLSDPVPIVVDGTVAQVQTFDVIGIKFPKRSYFDQLTDNFGQSLGVSLSIPIYNRHVNKISMEQARLNTLNNEVLSQQTRQQLKTDIQRAITDANAAKLALEAAQSSLEAAEAAFANSERRFELGAINTLEYTAARNNLDLAQVSVTRAKYQYLFNTKIVEFYQGRTLALE